MKKTNNSHKTAAAVDLEKYLDELIGGVRSDIASLKENVNEKFEAQRLIADKTEQIVRVQLDRLGEFKERVEVAQGNIVTRELCDAKMSSLMEKTQIQETKQAFLSGREAGVASIVGVIFLAGELVLRFIFK